VARNIVDIFIKTLRLGGETRLSQAMAVSKKAEKVAEAKYDVVYHCESARWLGVTMLTTCMTSDPNLDLHPAAVSGNVGLVH
jgi:hypothetical protein